MNNPVAPVSLEAARMLLAMERIHSPITDEERTYARIEDEDPYCSACFDEYPDPDAQLGSYLIFYYEWPCGQLTEIRNVASPETLKYVQIQLALERGGK